MVDNRPLTMVNRLVATLVAAQVVTTVVPQVEMTMVVVVAIPKGMMRIDLKAAILND